MDNDASIGIGTMIIFIAMILVAGIAASVLIQTMGTLQNQAMTTGTETINDVSTGLKITHVSATTESSGLTNLCFLISPISASQAIDLSTVVLHLNDGDISTILQLNTSIYAGSISTSLFETLNLSLLNPTEYGIIVLSDYDQSCTQTNPVINDHDNIAILVNTTTTFSGGIGKRTTVQGTISPEQGISATISFTTPSVFIDRVIQLVP